MQLQKNNNKKATAQLVIPETADIGMLETELENLANDLMVTIGFT